MTRLSFVADSNDSQHITIQSYNREKLFYEESDYRYCLSQLKKAFNHYGCGLHAYVLMPEHIQLLFSSQQDGCIIKTIELLEQGYTEYFNFTHRRIRRILELDYSRVLVDADHHLLTYYRYIELVPVRVQLVDHPADYPWSSFGFNAMGEDTGLLIPHPKYLELGPDEQERRRKYRDLFVECRPQKRLNVTTM